MWQSGRKERRGKEGTNWLDISATLCVVDRFSLAVAPPLIFQLIALFLFFLFGSFSTFFFFSALTLFMMARPDLLADLFLVQLRVSPLDFSAFALPNNNKYLLLQADYIRY